MGPNGRRVSLRRWIPMEGGCHWGGRPQWKEGSPWGVGPWWKKGCLLKGILGHQLFPSSVTFSLSWGENFSAICYHCDTVWVLSQAQRPQSQVTPETMSPNKPPFLVSLVLAQVFHHSIREPCVLHVAMASVGVVVNSFPSACSWPLNPFDCSLLESCFILDWM